MYFLNDNLEDSEMKIINMSSNLRMMACLVFSGLLMQSVYAQTPPSDEPIEMGFFVTSVGLGKGGDLGGLAGADAHCQSLAAAVEAGHRTWRAYLSTQVIDDKPAVNARDRIGNGPWGNAKGVVIATNLESLMYDNSNINYQHALTEKGHSVNSRIMNNAPIKHDILTGTRIDGTAFPAGDDRTCSNWTSSDKGSAMVGHSDRHRGSNPGSPWNTAHPSRGCSQENLVGTGGDGLFYCFATD